MSPPAFSRMVFPFLLLGLLVVPLSLPAGPAEKAAEYHRDSQRAGEGIALAEVEDGAPATFGSAGVLREDGPAVDENTLFEIGSITKVFTGILLADAVLKKKAALEDPVSKHLPADLLVPDSPLHHVTLLELATHHSGLPRLPDNLAEGIDSRDPYAHYSVERLYRYLKEFRESDFEKRGEMSYSNLGMGLLGHLLERMGGKPYETLLRETLLEPLGMDSSFVQRTADSVPADLADRFATGHTGGRAVPHWHLDSLCGAGAVVSTARDLARFAEAHWSERTPPSLLAAMELAATPQRGNIGLAWFIGEQGLFHDGGTGGFRSELRIFPEKKTASVRLINSTGPSQTKSEGDFSSLRGYWSGYLGGKAGLFLILEIESDSGTVEARIYSPDQTPDPIPVNSISFDGTQCKLAISSIQASFSAALEDKTRMSGAWLQGAVPLPLTLTKSEKRPQRE